MKEAGSTISKGVSECQFTLTGKRLRKPMTADINTTRGRGHDNKSFCPSAVARILFPFKVFPTLCFIQSRRAQREGPNVIMQNRMGWGLV